MGHPCIGFIVTMETEFNCLPNGNSYVSATKEQVKYPLATERFSNLHWGIKKECMNSFQNFYDGVDHLCIGSIVILKPEFLGWEVHLKALIPIDSEKMKIVLGIWVLTCIYVGVEAQVKYGKNSNLQQVRYDDDEPTYNHQSISGLDRRHSSRPYEHENPEQHGYYNLRDLSHNNPQVVYYRHNAAPGYPVSNSPGYKSRISQYERPEELQYSHGPDHRDHPQTVPKIPLPSPEYHNLQAPKLSHASLVYQSPKYSKPDAPQALYKSPEYHQPNPKLSHASVVYNQPKSSHDYPEYPKQESPQTTHQSPANYKSQESPEHTIPKYPQPESHGNSGNSRVVRDPRLPLYFTMYEKRIVQDPLDKYGKGPWRYLTYGHGITYGSKEPGKVFEKGYGYIKALGRDHCKLPENKCPRRDDDKPFEYQGRKEPYFGYRPH
ncbi:uncharacterized protein CEXT_102091 [Caerostris extrusa]|uniref:Uncharacterized protein n=1 Tax=Caerostris extrusa TaxID=172846 RepID=A0AAV4V2S0_CAEEX|nr:uncharacterized protein CEXT_102091 [Caerostris extrusa]